jgi:hypothetical protein
MNNCFYIHERVYVYGCCEKFLEGQSMRSY